MIYFKVNNIEFKTWLKNGQAYVQRVDGLWILDEEKLGLQMIAGTFFEFRDIIFIHGE